MNWNGTPLTTTFVNQTQLTGAVPASNIAAAGTAQVTVSNPGPGGGTSAAQPFSIKAISAPTIVFNIANHTFGDAPFQVAATSNSTGAISYSVISGPATILGSTLTITGAGPISVQASQIVAGEYTAVSQSTSFMVGKAPATLALSSSANPVVPQNPVTFNRFLDLGSDRCSYIHGWFHDARYCRTDERCSRIYLVDSIDGLSYNHCKLLWRREFSLLNHDSHSSRTGICLSGRLQRFTLADSAARRLRCLQSSAQSIRYAIARACHSCCQRPACGRYGLVLPVFCHSRCRTYTNHSDHTNSNESRRFQ